MNKLKLWQNGIDDLFFGNLIYRFTFPVSFVPTKDPMRIDVECDADIDFKKCIADKLELTIGDDGYFCFDEMKKYLDVWTAAGDWSVSAFGYSVFYGTIENNGELDVQSHNTYSNELIEYVKCRLAELEGKEDPGVMISRLCNNEITFDESSVDCAHNMTDVLHLKESVFTRTDFVDTVNAVKYLPNLTLRNKDYAIIMVNDEAHLVQYLEGWLVFAQTPQHTLSVSLDDSATALIKEIENYKGDK